MNAVNWLRSRQEERELAYWLSIVAYVQQDRSISNRLYLIYLFIFFSIWIFVTLTFFATGGAALLRMINPADPASAAALLEIIVLGAWFLYSLWQSQKHSPVLFSEEDALLVCQTPVSRRQVTLRWFLMSWFKSAVSFWLAAVTLGFSVAEISLPGGGGATAIPQYAGFGLRAWLALLPVHTALYALQWAAGVFRLQQDRERRWLAWVVIPPALAFITILLIGLLDAGNPLPSFIAAIFHILLYPTKAGFEVGSLPAAALPAWAAALAAFGILAWAAGNFSLSRASQETGELEKVNSALRYGFGSYAEALKTRKRLGMGRKPFRLPARPGPAALLWKDVLQSLRPLRFVGLLDWLILFSLGLAIPLLPDFGSKAIATGVWMIRVGKLSVIRLRSDLACWPLARQLPVSPYNFVGYETGLAYLLVIILGLAGLVIGSNLAGAPLDRLAGLVPGIAAGMAGMAAFDVIKSASSNLLTGGSIPDVGARGVILGLILALIPVLINQFVPTAAGWLAAVLISLVLGAASLYLAGSTYRKIIH